MIVEFRPAARQELIEAATWYATEGSPAVADQFALAVERAVELLKQMPRIGSSRGGGLRAWSVKHFPYTLVYRVQGERLTVLAVAHQSREPGYWVGRR